MSKELHPGIYFTIWVKEKKSDDLDRRDSYDCLEVAIEMGQELVKQYGFYEVVIKDAKGNQVHQETKLN